jgi:hypothetical protein
MGYESYRAQVSATNRAENIGIRYVDFSLVYRSAQIFPRSQPMRESSTCLHE